MASVAEVLRVECGVVTARRMLDHLRRCRLPARSRADNAQGPSFCCRRQRTIDEGELLRTLDVVVSPRQPALTRLCRESTADPRERRPDRLVPLRCATRTVRSRGSTRPEDPSPPVHPAPPTRERKDMTTALTHLTRQRQFA